ncbi:MAG: sarcosine oxidase subunit delta [Gemmatimonadales bacterium]|nr:sarcosine oxidase subunit delta [Gemmatimonadota bacterium]MCC7132945.1 sarcosine oxidase subunit delta [Gemmatimonadales bacterium]MDX2056781.1 sarcosine oxidase subunit delta [Gemmatimonadales bacterium]
MPLLIPCPTCGVRPYGEFWCSGELPDGGHGGSDDAEADFERVWLKRNVAGLQTERWFHHAGCRRWVTVRRDTLTNVIDAQL